LRVPGENKIDMIDFKSTQGFFSDTVDSVVERTPLDQVPSGGSLLAEITGMCKIDERKLILVGYPLPGAHGHGNHGTIVTWQYSNLG
jgi:hypothetical protein